jgi:hypothetical protein
VRLLNRSAIANHVSSVTRLTAHSSPSTTIIPHSSTYRPPIHHRHTTIPLPMTQRDNCQRGPKRAGEDEVSQRHVTNPNEPERSTRRGFRQDQVSKPPPLAACSRSRYRYHVAVSNVATKWMTWHEGRTTTTNHGPSQRRSSVMRRPPRWTKMADNNDANAMQPQRRWAQAATLHSATWQPNDERRQCRRSSLFLLLLHESWYTSLRSNQLR